MVGALDKFRELDSQLLPLLEAAVLSDEPAGKRTRADEVIFEANRYIETPPAPPPAAPPAVATSSDSKGYQISFRSMTLEDCRLWCQPLEDFVTVQDITSQINKFTTLTTLLSEEEAFVIRDLTMMGEERPANVFDAARTLFIERYELTVHQRLTRAMAMSGIATDEKPSQWMARFRQVGCSWDREDIELWALLGRLPPTLRTSLEHHTPQLSMEELLRKADSLYVTLPLTTIATITEVSAELAYAVQAGDLLAVNAILKGHWILARIRRRRRSVGTTENSATSLDTAAGLPARGTVRILKRVDKRCRETQ